MSGFAGNGPSGAGRLSRYQFTLAAGQTLVSGKDDNSLTLRIPIGMESVYFKGKKLPPTDYLVTSSSITLPGGAAAFDVLEVYAPEVQTNANTFDRLQDGADINDKVKFRSYLPNPGAIFGLTMSTAGSSNTITVAAGFAADSTNVKLMRLAAPLAKTTAAFVVGAGGGLDAGTMSVNTWYHIYQIYNPTTDACDIIFSLNASAPSLALAPGYTLYRRIGTWPVNASGQWHLIRQTGDEFLWDTPNMSMPQTTYNQTTAILSYLTTPPGLRVDAIIEYVAYYMTTGAIIYVSSPDTADIAPTGTTAMSRIVTPNNGYAAGRMTIRTNISQQIRERCNVPDAGRWIFTLGWIDTRGRLG